MARHSLLLLAVLAVSLAVCRAEDKDTTYAGLGVPKYTITLSFGNEYNNNYNTPDPCTNDNPSNSTCLPQVYPANGDCIKIAYALNSSVPSAVTNASSTVTLKGCFSPTSSMNRGWRKPKPSIYHDMHSQCNVKIAGGLAPGNGTYTWCPSEDVPAATMRVRAFEECMPADGAPMWCAFGTSKGFFQIDQHYTLPGWFLACTGVFAAVGPVALALFFVWEFKIKKA